MSVDSLIDRLRMGGAAVQVENPGKQNQVTTTFSKDFINPPPPPPIVEVAQPASTITEVQAFTAAPEPVVTKPAKLAKEPKTAKPPKVEVAAPQITRSGYELYIDCLTDGCRPFPFHEANAAVAAKAGVADYRLVEYGGGPGLLAVAVRDMLTSGHFDGTKIFVSTSQQETNACLSILQEGANSVTRRS